jgi:hypothetical protein
MTSGSSVMNSTAGRSLGRRSWIQYAVGTTSRMPKTMVATASAVE